MTINAACKIVSLLSLFGLFLTSCIDEFDDDFTEYQNLMVVDGGITNLNGPHSITLSKTSNTSNPQFTPVESANVTILDDMGNSFQLFENNPGIYETDSNFIGVPGISYKINIVTFEGKTYESAFEELKDPVEIDTVYHAVVKKQDITYDYDLYGYEFYVNTRIANQNENYFKWDLTATYHYQSDFTIRWYFDGEDHWFHGPDSLYNCWTTKKIHSIFTSSTNELTSPVITGFPFHFVSTESRELSVRYSLLTEQHTISRNAYEFWREIEKQNGDDDGLYTTQPHFIEGNIVNTTDPDEMVLGYFMVSGVDLQRIFVDRPPPSIPMRYNTCVLTEADFEAYGQRFLMDPVTYPLYLIESPGGRRALPNKYCVDCRLKGGTIEKPAFWIDN